MSSPFYTDKKLIFHNKNNKISVTFPIQNPSYRVRTN